MVSKNLPRFDGRKIDAIDIKARGPVGDDRTNDALDLGDEVLVIGRAVVSRILHQSVEKRGLVRTQVVELIEAYVTEGESATSIEVLLADAAAARRAELDRILGREPLPFDDSETDS